MAKLAAAPIVENGDKSFTVWLEYDGVDRRRSVGMNCGPHKALAERLSKACLAGIAAPLEPETKYDIYGKSFSSGHFNVSVRSIKSDLKRLGA